MPKKQTKNSMIEDFGPNNDQSFMQYRLSHNPPKGRLSRAKAWLLNHKKAVVVFLIVILFGGWAINNYISLKAANDKLENFKDNPTASSQDEAKKIVEAVGELVILPDGEQPTVATVTDPSKLSDQPFFANSQSGDKVLIYENAQRAILYRPSSNKVIEIAPLNLGGSSTIDAVRQSQTTDQDEESTPSGDANTNDSEAN